MPVYPWLCIDQCGTEGIHEEELFKEMKVILFPRHNKKNMRHKHIPLWAFGLFFLLSHNIWAQVPDSFSYQMVVRDSNADVVRNGVVSIEVSVRQDSSTGQALYTEIHSDTTSISGLASLIIGSGSSPTGDLSAIDWSDGPYFLSVRTDTEGGTDFGGAQSMEIVSVPYALYSDQADSALVARYADTVAISVSSEGDTLFLGDDGAFVIVPGLSEANPNQTCLEDTTEVVTVTTATGRVWMDRNLGAFQAATSVDDPLAFGGYYQWGRDTDGHQCRDSDTSQTLATTAAPDSGNVWDGKFIVSKQDATVWLDMQDEANLWQGINGVNNPCPTGFRVPTEVEWESEIATWGGDDANADSAFASPLRLPATGNRAPLTGAVTLEGVNVVYWSSTISGDLPRRLLLTSKFLVTGANRSNGHAVRCIKHIPPVTGCEEDTTAVVEVTSAGGQVWMDRNLGAQRAAMSSTDSLAYGAWYQWGRDADGHQCRDSDTTSTVASTATAPGTKFIVNAANPFDWLSPQDSTLWQGVNGVNNPCPTGYRIPSAAEWDAERLSWVEPPINSTNNSAGAFASPLKLPVAGSRNGSSGVASDVGLFAYYWSSSVSGSDARFLNFLSTNAKMYSISRTYGFAVRCIKNPPPVTGCLDTTGIVEVTSANNRVWMDRNLGADRAAIAINDSLAFGALYQWGRASDGHQCRNSPETSVNATTATADPGQDWAGKFITENAFPNDWLDPQTDTLWEKVNGGNNPCPTGFRLPTQSEWDTEFESWSSKSDVGAFGSPLKLPVSGRRNKNSGDVVNVGEYGYYWSSAVSDSLAISLVFSSNSCGLNGKSRASGYAVRCIKNLPIDD